MNFVNRFRHPTSILALIALMFASSVPNIAQQQTEDVLRINTELVQTGVTVLDSRGNFVSGLKREQFELTVEGKQQTISFFEQVEAGSDRERRQAALPTRETKDQPTASSTSYGRTISFNSDSAPAARSSSSNRAAAKS